MASTALAKNEVLLQSQIKPLSKNGFIAFFQTIARWWIGVWSEFSTKHPKLSKLIYQLGFFFAFSMAVTVWQFLIMLFLPAAFGPQLNDTAFEWPKIALPGWFASDGEQLFWGIFNEPKVSDLPGNPAFGGLGNFLAFEIAVFTAQCINFPLQRNITFKSHGNVAIQIMWYFIGWVLISVFVSALWGILNPIMLVLEWNIHLGGAFGLVQTLIKTFVTGGVSMIIFFFIFLVIFPDYQKVAKKQQKKLDKMITNDAEASKIAKQTEKTRVAVIKASLSTTRKTLASASSKASSRSIAYFSLLKKDAKLDERIVQDNKDNKDVTKLNEKKVEYSELSVTSMEKALEAIEEKNNAQKDYDLAIKEAGPITIDKRKKETQVQS